METKCSKLNFRRTKLVTWSQIFFFLFLFVVVVVVVVKGRNNVSCRSVNA